MKIKQILSTRNSLIFLIINVSLVFTLPRLSKVKIHTYKVQYLFCIIIYKNKSFLIRLTIHIQKLLRISIFLLNSIDAKLATMANQTKQNSNSTDKTH